MTQSNDTWRIEAGHQGCVVRELDHYGELGTGFIWCSTHGEVAGTIDYATPNPTEP